MERRATATLLAGLMAIAIAACGGSPNGPAPINGGGSGGVTPPPSGPNSAPIIDSIDVSSERAEVETDVSVTAHVHDLETPVDQLKYEWKAEGGTFSGAGASVKWHAPTPDKTPRDFTISLTVTETYGNPDASGNRPQHVVTGTSPAIRVHNSSKELGDLGLAFLTDFANSRISSSVCLRDFSDSCRGKSEEKGDIDWNRDHFTVLSSSLKLTSVNVKGGATSADITIACSFTSRVDKCEPGDTDCKVGSVGTVDGICSLTGKYEQKRWWLCDSHFSGHNVPASMKSFWR